MSASTGMVVASPAMMELLSMADRASKSPTKVLITGESGVGKDLVARYIHNQSPRKAAPFVAVNCAGLTETLLESEISVTSRSFTGAFATSAARSSWRTGHCFSTKSRDEQVHAGAPATVPREPRDQAVGSGSAPDACRRSCGRCHQPEPQRSGGRRAVPRGSLLSSVCHPPARASAARAARRRSGPDEALSRPLGTGADVRGRSEAGVPGIPMAGERAGTAERSRTAGLVVDDRCRAGERPAGHNAHRHATWSPAIAAARLPTISTTRSSSRERRSGITSTRCFSHATSRDTTCASSFVAACRNREDATSRC